MTKPELIDRINKATLADKKIVANVLDCLADIMTMELEAGNEITLPRIGTLRVKQRGARKGRNPATGQPIDIAAKRVVDFSPLKPLRDAVAG